MSGRLAVPGIEPSPARMPRSAPSPAPAARRVPHPPQLHARRRSGASSGWPALSGHAWGWQSSRGSGGRRRGGADRDIGLADRPRLDQPPVLYLMVAIVAVRAFGSAARRARRRRLASHDAAFRVLAGLRSDAYRRLERLAPAGLAEYRSGDLVARLVADIDSLADVWLRVLLPYAVVGIVGAGPPAVALLVPAAGAALAVTLLITAAGAPLAASAMARRAEGRTAPPGAAGRRGARAASRRARDRHERRAGAPDGRRRVSRSPPPRRRGSLGERRRNWALVAGLAGGAAVCRVRDRRRRRPGRAPGRRGAGGRSPDADLRPTSWRPGWRPLRSSSPVSGSRPPASPKCWTARTRSANRPVPRRAWRGLTACASGASGPLSVGRP